MRAPRNDDRGAPVDPTLTAAQEAGGRRGGTSGPHGGRCHEKAIFHVFHVRTKLDAEAITYDTRCDSLFPLITNDRGVDAYPTAHDLPLPAQPRAPPPRLEGPQEVASILLETPHRIEALLTCHFFAHLVEALMELEIRTIMKSRVLEGIALYPELRNCPALSVARVLEILDDVQRHCLMRSGEVVQVFEPELSELQLQVLDLLHAPRAVYLPSGSACG